jgi:hypothetical protein
MSDATEVFTRIYNDHLWGGVSRSGPGSDPRLLRSYLDCVLEKRGSKEMETSTEINVPIPSLELCQMIDSPDLEFFDNPSGALIFSG